MAKKEAQVESLSVRPGQLTRLLRAIIKAGEALLITGAPGVGKTDLTHQACEAEGADMIVSHPVVSDPTDAKGLPWPVAEKGEATFLPFGELAQALKATKRTVWFLDDLGQAAPSVQAAFMQLLLARRINGQRLPDCVSFVAATNRRGDRAGVSGILEPVKSRFASIVELAPTLDDWCEWALTHGAQPEVVSFLRFRPNLLWDFSPTADLCNSPSPRTWGAVSRLLAMGLPKDLELPTLAGAVGQGAAGELVAFLRMYRELPNPDAIILDPKGSPIPSGASALYATATAVASRVTTKNFERILQYAERLQEDSKGEFAALMIRDSFRREQKISSTPAFTKLLTTELGKTLLGTVAD